MTGRHVRHNAIPVIPSAVEGSRGVTFKAPSTGFLDSASLRSE
jgi:hypothetical protein